MNQAIRKSSDDNSNNTNTEHLVTPVQPGVNGHFVALVLGVALMLMVGWLLIIGKSILLPILAAVISIYVLTTAAEALKRVPGLGHSSEWFRRFIVLLIFVVVIVLLVGVVLSTVDQVIALAPTYQENLEKIVNSVATSLHLEEVGSWEAIRERTIGQMDVAKLLGFLVASLSSVGTQVFLIVIYTVFMLAERGSFGSKLSQAFSNPNQSKRVASLISDINTRIGDYLTTKTVINIILAIISYAIMWWMQIDFALFWAIFIGLLNYIPYVGSLVGVMFPVVLTLAQYGSIQTALIVAALLTIAQQYVGNILEPKMIGKSVNMSPFVVLVSLAAWSSIWGLPGAILAIPLTAMFVIIFASFDSTRFISVMLSSHHEKPADNLQKFDDVH